MPEETIRRRPRPRVVPIFERAWNLFEWTWKLAVTAIVAAMIGFASANDPSWDDLAKSVPAGIVGMYVAKLRAKKGD